MSHVQRMVIQGEIANWRQSQRLFSWEDDTGRVELNNIQHWCESLAELLWRLRQLTKQVWPVLVMLTWLLVCLRHATLVVCLFCLLVCLFIFAWFFVYLNVCVCSVCCSACWFIFCVLVYFACLFVYLYFCLFVYLFVGLILFILLFCLFVCFYFCLCLFQMEILRTRSTTPIMQQVAPLTAIEQRISSMLRELIVEWATPTMNMIITWSLVNENFLCLFCLFVCFLVFVLIYLLLSFQEFCSWEAAPPGDQDC